MHERVARSLRPEADDCPARHCWVADPADRSGRKRAGLLVEWRRAESGEGWEGRVIYAAELRVGRWSVVEEWVAEFMLTSI